MNNNGFHRKRFGSQHVSTYSSLFRRRIRHAWELAVTTATWLAFSIATLAATGSPGPNAMLVVRNTVRYGLYAALFTVSGNLCSRFVMASGVMLGLSALLNASPWLVIGLRLAGALYLIWLGIRAMRGQGPQAAVTHVTPHVRQPCLRIFVEAATVSLVNPNTLGFFAAAVPQLVDLHTPILPQLATLIAIDTTVVLTVMSTYAFVTHAVHRRITSHSRLMMIRRGGGAALVIVGLTMLPLR
nr:LysE family translocator [Caballeronia sp. GAWG2-1]